MRAALRAVLSWALLGCIGWSVSLGAAAQERTFHRYGKAEGLANLNVLCVLQSRDGFLWVGTENGVFRYDGTEFRRYGEREGLDNTLIYALAEDGSGRLWVATPSDLFIGQRGSFRPVRPAGRAWHSSEGASLVPIGDQRMATIGDGHAVVLEVDSAASPPTPIVSTSASAPAPTPLFTPAQRVALPALDTVNLLYRDVAQHDWMGCGVAICEADVNADVNADAPANAHHPRAWGIADGVPADQWLTILVDRAGRVWARGQHHLLMRAPSADRFEEQDLKGLALTSFDTSAPMVEGPDGSIVVRLQAGLGRWKDGRWERLGAENGLDPADIESLLFDHVGGLWISHAGHGLARWLGYNDFASWTTNQGLTSNTIWGLHQRPGVGLLVGTSEGCRLIKPAAERAEPCPFTGLPAGDITRMTENADGHLWILMRRGDLYDLPPGATAVRHLAALPRATGLLLDRRQQLWVASREGVWRLDTMRPGAAIERVSPVGVFMDIDEDSAGDIWAVGADGVSRYDAGRWQHYSTGDPREVMGYAGIAPAPGGWLWLASRSRGLLHAHVSGGTIDRAAWVDDPAIASSGLMFVRTDTRGWVWAGTENGVVVFDGRSWRRYGQDDGLIWDDVDGNSFQADADGSVWVGTSGGLTHVLHPEALVQTQPLTLRVIGASFGGEQAAPVSGQRWRWRANAALDLRLASFCYDRSPQSVFRYRIAGLDTDWVESRNPQVRYSTLDPGRYQLEAVLIDPDHQRSSPQISFDFEIVPPWWRTVWFMLIEIWAAIGVAVLFWRWQLRRLHARHAALRRELHERSKLLERATRDALTGLFNRATVLDTLHLAIDQARSTGGPLGVAIIDVDHFKSVNDTHGHLGGDAVLRALASRLQAHLRVGDTLGRYGGEELLLVMPALPAERPALAVERLRAVIADTAFTYEGRNLRITASFGVAWLDCADDSVESLLQRADTALYAAKTNGRDRVDYA